VDYQDLTPQLLLRPGSRKFVASQKRDLWDISDQQKEFRSPGQGRDGGTGSRHGRAAMGGRR
jgi:hypothetical protein